MYPWDEAVTPARSKLGGMIPRVGIEEPAMNNQDARPLLSLYEPSDSAVLSRQSSRIYVNVLPEPPRGMVEVTQRLLEVVNTWEWLHGAALCAGYAHASEDTGYIDAVFRQGGTLSRFEYRLSDGEERCLHAEIGAIPVPYRPVTEGREGREAREYAYALGETDEGIHLYPRLNVALLNAAPGETAGKAGACVRWAWVILGALLVALLMQGLRR